MSNLSLVVLAAGRGTRFGGPKQLEQVREDGASITDVNIERARSVGIVDTVVVVSDATAEEMGARLADTEPPVAIVHQGGTRGTAQALLATQDVTDGPVLVVNADDLYPIDMFSAARSHLDGPDAGEHAVIGFRLERTLYGSRSQSRALLEVADGHLAAIREGQVTLVPDLAFAPKGDPTNPHGVELGPEPLRGDELVSMNAMVLQRDIFDALDAAMAASTADEVFLPDVVAAVVGRGEPVRVLTSEGSCHGLTYPEDIDTLDALL